jgi:alpha-mannosidase
MDQGVQEFAYELVPHEGSWRDAGIVRKAYEFNVPPAHVIETYHEGTLPQSYSGIAITSDHIVATAFKITEEGDGYVLRCFETSGTAAEVEIEIPMLGRKWSANFNRCEIKTFKISLDPEREVVETDLLET